MKLLFGFVETVVPSRLRWYLVILIDFCNVNAVWHENRRALHASGSTKMSCLPWATYIMHTNIYRVKHMFARR